MMWRGSMLWCRLWSTDRRGLSTVYRGGGELCFFLSVIHHTVVTRINNCAHDGTFVVAGPLTHSLSLSIGHAALGIAIRANRRSRRARDRDRRRLAATLLRAPKHRTDAIPARHEHPA